MGVASTADEGVHCDEKAFFKCALYALLLQDTLDGVKRRLEEGRVDLLETSTGDVGREVLALHELALIQGWDCVRDTRILTWKRESTSIVV